MTDPIYWSPGVTLEAVEKQVILKAFRWFRGNKTQTSIALGISIRTLENKLEKYEDDGRKQELAEQADREKRQAHLNRARGLTVAPTQESTSVHGTGSGVHAQSSAETGPQHSMPVSESKKVQEVLPSKASAGREQRRR